MSGTLRTWFAAIFESGERHQMYPETGLNSPVGEVTIAGLGRVIREQQIGPEATAQLYNYSDDGPFELWAARILGAGYLQLAIQVDSPVSVSDPTPSGNDRSWFHFDLSCHAPFVLCSDEVRLHATQSVHVGDTANLPSLWDGANYPDSLQGRIYQIRARNPSDEDTVTLERVRFN